MNQNTPPKVTPTLQVDPDFHRKMAQSMLDSTLRYCSANGLRIGTPGGNLEVEQDD